MQNYKYLDTNDPAIQELEDKLGDVGRTGKYITYGDLIKGVRFRPKIQSGGLAYTVASFGRWNDLDKAIMGEYLSYISKCSLDKHRFLASALVVGNYEGPQLSSVKPGEGFFSLARHLGVVPEDMEDEDFFWSQLSKAHDYYMRGGTPRLTP